MESLKLQSNSKLFAKSKLVKAVGVSKPTFLKKLEILCSDSSCPISYDYYKSIGHYIEFKFALYIYDHLS